MKNPFGIAHFQGLYVSFGEGIRFETVFSGDSRFPPTKKALGGWLIFNRKNPNVYFMPIGSNRLPQKSSQREETPTIHPARWTAGSPTNIWKGEWSEPSSPWLWNPAVNLQGCTTLRIPITTERWTLRSFVCLLVGRRAEGNHQLRVGSSNPMIYDVFNPTKHKKTQKQHTRAKPGKKSRHYPSETVKHPASTVGLLAFFGGWCGMEL